MGKSTRLARSGSVVLLALYAPPAAAADEPRRLAPSTEWSVSRDGESCFVAREFGGERNGVTFALQAFSPEAVSYNVVLQGNALPSRDPGAIEFAFRFGPDAVALPTTGVLGGSKLPRLTFSVSLEAADVLAARRNGDPLPPTIDSAREAAVDELELAFSRGRPFLLQLGAMTEPLRQLRECTAGLPERWGLDPAVQRSLSRAPVPIDTASWIGPGSYPWEYLRNAMSVRVFVRLMTDEQGAVSQCVVQSPRGENIAGAIVCRELVRNARFEPALDLEGHPVPGYHTTMIFFNTPRHNGPLRGQSRTQGL